MNKILTTSEAAAELGVTRTRVTVLITSGKLPATKHGRDWMIDPADLEQVRERPTGRPPKEKVSPAKKAGGKGK